MLNKILNYITENELIENEDKILVALSGGPDSVCLLHILNELKEKLNIKIGAIHINHMLRGAEADGDEEYIKNLCEKLGIDCYVKRIDIECIAKRDGISLEVAGRNARYNSFEKIKKQYRYNKIAVAHNANDQAETIIMRLMRGAGIEGLTGIKCKREGGIIRPILCLKREEIEKYCHDNNLNPRIDASNLERVYSRNKVRLDILPYMKENFNKDIIETLNRMALLLQKDNEFIEAYSKKCYDRYCKSNGSRMIISHELFEREKEAIITRVIKTTFKEISKSHQNFEMKHIYEIVNLAQKNSGKKIDLTNNIICENLYGDIVFKIRREKKEINTKEIVLKKENLNPISFGEYEIGFYIIEKGNKEEISKNDFIKLFDYDKINRDIIIRYRKDGDKMIPFGMKGNKKLKDILIDLKIPRDNRDLIPIVCFDDKISWVVGYKTSDEFKLTKDTNKILKIIFSRKE